MEDHAEGKISVYTAMTESDSSMPEDLRLLYERLSSSGLPDGQYPVGFDIIELSLEGMAELDAMMNAMTGLGRAGKWLDTSRISKATGPYFKESIIYPIRISVSRN
jgi:hypothetical protein